MSDQPSETGKRKYPPDGLYDDIPCTCVESCPEPCKGYAPCECKACSAGYQDYLDSER